MTEPDQINVLMARCEAARRRCEAVQDEVFPGGERWTVEDFRVLWYPENERPWYVGFYERDQGKQTADGVTLVEALTAWLDEYEHAWDGGREGDGCE